MVREALVLVGRHFWCRLWGVHVDGLQCDRSSCSVGWSRVKQCWWKWVQVEVGAVVEGDVVVEVVAVVEVDVVVKVDVGLETILQRTRGLFLCGREGFHYYR